MSWLEFNTRVLSQAADNRVPYHLLKAQIWQESRFKVDAVSHAGALGLMQLMPRTAKELGVKHPFNPEENINAGARYVRKQFDRYKDTKGLDRWRMALASYNCGAGYVISARKDARKETFSVPQRNVRIGPFHSVHLASRMCPPRPLKRALLTVHLLSITRGNEGDSPEPERPKRKFTKVQN